MQAIDIKNLNFSYRNIKVFDDLNLSISEDSFTTILGKNGSGKTTLANILSGFLKYKGDILILDKPFTESQNAIETLFSDLDDYDTYDSVINMFVLLNSVDKRDVQKNILDISSEFEFSDVLDFSFNSLSFLKKKLVVLGIALIKNPKILVLDNFFDGMNKDLKKRILKKLKKLAKKKKITVVNITTDVEDTLLSDSIMIIDEGKVVLKGNRKKVFENEAFFETYDVELPFIVNLSDKLKFYELIDRIYFDEKKLVDDLWE